MINKIDVSNYYLTRSLMIVLGYSTILRIASEAAILSVIIGTIFNILIFKLIKQLDIKINSNILLFIYIIMCLLILSIFVKSTYLSNTPSIVIISIFILLVFHLVKKGYDVQQKVFKILFLSSFILFVIFCVSLIKYVDFNYVGSFNDININNIISASIFYSTITLIPNLINNNLGKSYLFSSITILITLLLIITVVGNKVSLVYNIPEYMLLKRVKIFSFLENIENIVSFMYIIDIFCSLCISINNLLQQKKK